MIIHLCITSNDGDAVVDKQVFAYEELVAAVKELKPLIISVESGGDGFSTCIECGKVFPFGEDARADAGMKCGDCQYSNGD